MICGLKTRVHCVCGDRECLQKQNGQGCWWQDMSPPDQLVVHRCANRRVKHAVSVWMKWKGWIWSNFTNTQIWNWMSCLEPRESWPRVHQRTTGSNWRGRLWLFAEHNVLLLKMIDPWVGLAKCEKCFFHVFSNFSLLCFSQTLEGENGRKIVTKEEIFQTRLGLAAFWSDDFLLFFSLWLCQNICGNKKETAEPFLCFFFKHRKKRSAIVHSCPYCCWKQFSFEAETSFESHIINPK